MKGFLVVVVRCTFTGWGVQQAATLAASPFAFSHTAQRDGTRQSGSIGLGIALWIRYLTVWRFEDLQHKIGIAPLVCLIVLLFLFYFAFFCFIFVRFSRAAIRSTLTRSLRPNAIKFVVKSRRGWKMCFPFAAAPPFRFFVAPFCLCLCLSLSVSASVSLSVYVHILVAQLWLCCCVGF